MRYVKFAFPYGDDIPRIGFEPLVVAQVALHAACAHSFFNGVPPLPAPQLMPQLQFGTCAIAANVRHTEMALL